MTKNPKQPKWQVGDIVPQRTTKWRREIIEVIPDYLSTPGRFGYHWYDPDISYYGMCSQEHLYEWSQR